MSALGFAAGAASGAAKSTHTAYKANIQERRDQRLQEWKSQEAEAARLFKADQAELDRDFKNQEATLKSDRDMDMQLQRDDAAMQRTRENNKYKGKKVVEPEFDPYTGQEVHSGGIADLDSGEFKNFKGQKARSYESADQVKKDYRDGKITRQEAMRKLRESGVTPY